MFKRRSNHVDCRLIQRRYVCRGYRARTRRLRLNNTLNVNKPTVTFGRTISVSRYYVFRFTDVFKRLRLRVSFSYWLKSCTSYPKQSIGDRRRGRETRCAMTIFDCQNGLKRFTKQKEKQLGFIIAKSVVWTEQ